MSETQIVISGRALEEMRLQNLKELKGFLQGAMSLSAWNQWIRDALVGLIEQVEELREDRDTQDDELEALRDDVENIEVDLSDLTEDVDELTQAKEG